MKIAPGVAIPKGLTSRFLRLVQFASDLGNYLGHELAVTSFYRSDQTAHRRAAALDVAFRSGPLYAARNRGHVVYYWYRPLWTALRAALESIGAEYPDIRRVVVEADHLHIDFGDADPELGRPVLGRYSPPVYNAITNTPGVLPQLRLETDRLPSWYLRRIYS
jgi:hypothetical protein